MSRPRFRLPERNTQAHRATYRNGALHPARVRRRGFLVALLGLGALAGLLIVAVVYPPRAGSQMTGASTVGVGQIDVREPVGARDFGAGAEFPTDVPDASAPVPEGRLIEEYDIPVDELGDLRPDLLPGAKSAEPLDPALEEHLEKLATDRALMRETIPDDPKQFRMPEFRDRDAPPRMDE